MMTHIAPTSSFAKLPPLPGKGKSQRKCACGCGLMTGGTWFSGHDGRATGWAIRVMKGVLTVEQVPANERPGALIMLARHGWKAPVTVPADIKFLQSRRAA